MTEEIRYTVQVRLARWGHISTVKKETKNVVPVGDGWPEWTSWEPKPEFWRPTEDWAIRRADRKRRKLMAQDYRRNSLRDVG